MLHPLLLRAAFPKGGPEGFFPPRMVVPIIIGVATLVYLGPAVYLGQLSWWQSLGEGEIPGEGTGWALLPPPVQPGVGRGRLRGLEAFKAD